MSYVKFFEILWSKLGQVISTRKTAQLFHFSFLTFNSSFSFEKWVDHSHLLSRWKRYSSSYNCWKLVLCNSSFIVLCLYWKRFVYPSMWVILVKRNVWVIIYFERKAYTGRMKLPGAHSWITIIASIKITSSPHVQSSYAVNEPPQNTSRA